MDPAQILVVARLWHYAAVLGLFGAALFPIHAFPRGSPRPPGLESSLRLTWRLCAVSALVSGLLWLMLSAAAMAGDLAAAVDPATLTLVLTATPFGQLWSGRLALALVLVLAALPARPSAAVIAAGGAVLVASLALTGHAAAAEGVQGWLHRASDAVHLLAAGAWLGALGAMASMLGRPDDDDAAAAAMMRFAGIGSVLVAALAASGIVNGWLILGGLEPLWTTDYGRLLLVKVAVFAAMLGLAAINRFWLAPAFAGQPGDPSLKRLRLAVAVENALGLGVLVLVAILGTLDPLP